MATTTFPTRDDFAALLNESLGGENEAFEGKVVKGTVTGIENDMAVIDVGLKSRRPRAAARVRRAGPEGRAQGRRRSRSLCRPRREQRTAKRCCRATAPAAKPRGTSSRSEFEAGNRVEGVIFGRVKGGFTVDLGGAVAFLPGSQVDIRPVRDVQPLMDIPQPFQILKMDRRRGNIVVSRRAILEETRAEQRSGPHPEPGRGPGHRRRRQEHHRLRCVRRPRRHRRPAPRHRRQLQARQSPVRSAQHRRHGEGADHPHQQRHAAHQPRHEAARERSVGRRVGQVSGRRQVPRPRHEHHRIWRVRRARAGHRRPGPRLGDELDQEERPPGQDRLAPRRKSK